MQVIFRLYQVRRFSPRIVVLLIAWSAAFNFLVDNGSSCYPHQYIFLPVSDTHHSITDFHTTKLLLDCDEDNQNQITKTVLMMMVNIYRGR